jgi:LAO/AO transport system kinase
MQISALLNQGVDSFWHRVLKFNRLQQAKQKFEQRRQLQAQSWMWERIDAGLKQNFRAQVSVQALLPELLHKVTSGQVPASTAARQLLAAYQATGFPTN